MATIQVRNLPDDAYEQFRSQAAAAGQSLQVYMREQLVTLARSRARKAAMLAELEDVLHRDGGTGVTVEHVLAALDEDRSR
jgi:plasmid stability protein